MTSILFSIFFLGLSAHSESIVKTCFPSTDFSKSKIECVLAKATGEMTFTLTEGSKIRITGPSKFGDLNKDFKVEKLTHMSPRLTDAGPMDESLRFFAKSAHGFQATMDFACRQTGFALVGFDAVTAEKELPKEHVAVCTIQAL